MVKLSRALTHHPPCKNFDKHVIDLGYIKVCAGCVMLLLGLVVGALLHRQIFYFVFFLNMFNTGVFGGVLMIAAFLIGKANVHLWLTRFARALMGFGIVFYIDGMFMSGVLAHGFQLVALAGLIIYAIQFKKKHKNICDTCAESAQCDERLFSK
ncbi:MAG: hypothetical protein ABIG30_03225 [Candidatus Aenigmatarchaeota archaeon]